MHNAYLVNKGPSAHRRERQSTEPPRNDSSLDIDLSIHVSSVVFVAMAASLVWLALAPGAQLPNSPLVWALTIAWAAALVMLMLDPRRAGWATILFSIALTLVMPAGTSRLVGLCVALVVLSYYSTLRWAIIAALCCAINVAVILASIPLPTVLATPAQWTIRTVAAAALSAGMVILGRLLTRGRYLAANRRQQAADEHEELVRLKHNNQLAIAIHDTLSNELTFVSSIARDRLQSDSPDAQAWSSVLERSQKAFEQVHAIIAYLDDPQHSSLPEPPFMDEVQRRLTDVHDQLAAMGYDGTCDCAGLFLGKAPDVQREVCSLLTELGTNISRHARKGSDSYLISVLVSEQCVEIRETNDIAPDNLTEAERSGRGLDMHRTRIRELGGVLHTNAEEGVWILYARLPWDASTDVASVRA
ncbi:hypothetical protein [Bifidobacterium oedipodis]|uniref:histidine kinase n=1 Tax=Bifidobacterium oedipodis TaxID=2675322 RepID=A0A7Y0EQS0_9BIFI|nr:hypothetical protein [Bifidobacterium sp. DSM 109957]NMM94739.1 histidine kinase [Bifidobacterium sp. DSM 109957]